MRRALHSPLLHFLLIGAAIYVAQAVTTPAVKVESTNTIRVSAGEISWLEDTWLKRWNRAPTAAERSGMIDQYVRESVLYREALAMGLDRDDVIIRRRLSQKLEFLYEDLAVVETPSAEELEEHFSTSLDRYREPELWTFRHIFIDPDARGDDTLGDAARILAELQALDPATQGFDEVGDPFMLQGYYPERTEFEIAKLFGKGFATSVAELSVGQWHGPVLSDYGVHLVYMHARHQPPAPTFEEVQARVLGDWQAEKRQEMNDQYIESLLQRYEVIIEDDDEGEVRPR